MAPIDDLIKLEAEHGSHLFARGYLITFGDPTYVPSAWRTHPLSPQARVAHDAALAFSSHTHKDTTVTVLGDVYSVDAAHATADAIVRRLATTLHRSLAQFDRALDRLHGRYVVISTRRGEDELRVTTDATGMKSACYAEGGTVVGSHASLVAANSSTEPGPDFGRGYGLPGSATQFKHVRMLIPNHELSVTSGAIRRYWPRARIRSRSVASSSKAATKLLNASLEGILARHGSALMSLTAGVDSRATLAIAIGSGQQDRLEFFTYHRGESSWTDTADLDAAKKFSKRYGLHHHEVPFNADDPRVDDLAPVFELNTNRAHGRALALTYRDEFADKDIVHIRSNLSEVARSFYRKKNLVDPPHSGADLVSIYYRSAHKPAREDPIWNDVRSEFDRFYEENEFERAAQFVDGRDLFYWEHRMGTWHSQVVYESDIAFDSLSLYNSRAALMALLGASLHDRLHDNHMKAIIARGDAYLATVEFNPTKDNAPKKAIPPDPVKQPEPKKAKKPKRSLKKRVRRNRYVRAVVRRARRLFGRG